MKTHPRVIGYLQRALNHELSAALHYTVQAVQADVWGLAALARDLRQSVHEELRHAEVLVRRMYAVGITPSTVGETRSLRIGRNQADLLLAGLKTEADAVRLYQEASDFCARIGDSESLTIFSRIMEDELQHKQDIECQLSALRE